MSVSREKLNTSLMTEQKGSEREGKSWPYFLLSLLLSPVLSGHQAVVMKEGEGVNGYCLSFSSFVLFFSPSSSSMTMISFHKTTAWVTIKERHMKRRLSLQVKSVNNETHTRHSDFMLSHIQSEWNAWDWFKGKMRTRCLGWERNKCPSGRNRQQEKKKKKIPESFYSLWGRINAFEEKENLRGMLRRRDRISTIKGMRVTRLSRTQYCKTSMVSLASQPASYSFFWLLLDLLLLLMSFLLPSHSFLLPIPLSHSFLFRRFFLESPSSSSSSFSCSWMLLPLLSSLRRFL